jgi:hypothetical protein
MEQAEAEKKKREAGLHGKNEWKSRGPIREKKGKDELGCYGV